VGGGKISEYTTRNMSKFVFSGRGGHRGGRGGLSCVVLGRNAFRVTSSVAPESATERFHCKLVYFRE